MKQSKRSTTAEIKGGGFKSHGRMELEASGRLNILEATGPFNLELVVAADAAQANSLISPQHPPTSTSKKETPSA